MTKVSTPSMGQSIQEQIAAEANLTELKKQNLPTAMI